MSRTIIIGASMILVCLLTCAVVRGQQDTTSQDKAQSQTQRSIAAEPELPRSGPDSAWPTPSLVVPRLVKFSGALKDSVGGVRGSAVGITFAIYKEQEGGAALWLETQNVQLDEQGHYSVLLGATKNEGVPVELFGAAESRWLGVQVDLPGEVEQPRVLLVSVPYALKAADAESLGGLPASAFALAQPGGSGSGPSPAGTPARTGGKSAASNSVTNAALMAGFIPVATDNAGTLGNSLLVESGNSMALGQGVSGNPTIQFDVNGGIRGTGLATNGRSVAVDAINTSALFLNGSNAMGVIGNSNAAFAPGVLFTKTSFYSGGVERMTIDGATGNIGIGTTTPAHKLDVVGGITASSFALASGHTMRGGWVAVTVASATGDSVAATISFPFQLASAPAAPVANFIAAGGASTISCPGSITNPQAAPGNLCVYERTATNSSFFCIGPLTNNSCNAADTFGAEIDFTAVAAGVVFTGGAWAVTAP